MSSLTFLLPGLRGPFPGLPEDVVPELPSLETFLAKARKRHTGYHTFYQHLCGLFGLEQKPGRDLPVAALSRLVDDTERPEGIWMRADPVHLKPGLNDLTLIDTAFIPFSQHDAILLGTPLQEIFTGLGWTLEIPIAQRWYLRLDQDLAIETVEIGEVRGRDVQQLMPTGRDRPKLDQLMTEVQMLLHRNQYNLDREQDGFLPLNSLWFWGCGTLPDSLNSRWSKIVSDDPVAHGLGVVTGTPIVSFYEGTEEFMSEPDVRPDILVVKDDLQVKTGYQDFTAWQETMYELEEKWFTPALTALREGDLKRVAIISDGMEYASTGWSLKKFWCRRRGVL